MNKTTAIIQGLLATDAAETRAVELLTALKLHADERYAASNPGKDYTHNPIPASGAGSITIGAIAFMCTASDLWSGYKVSCVSTDGAYARAFATEADAIEALSWVLRGFTDVCGLCLTPQCEHWQGDPRDTSIDVVRTLLNLRCLEVVVVNPHRQCVEAHR